MAVIHAEAIPGPGHRVTIKSDYVKCKRGQRLFDSWGRASSWLNSEGFKRVKEVTDKAVYALIIE